MQAIAAVSGALRPCQHIEHVANAQLCQDKCALMVNAHQRLRAGRDGARRREGGAQQRRLLQHSARHFEYACICAWIKQQWVESGKCLPFDG